MPSITAGDLTTGFVRAFVLQDYLPKGGMAFEEPTVAVVPSTAGTVLLQPSVAGVVDGSGGQTYTTAGVFTPAVGYLGEVTLSADIGAIDDQDVLFNIVAAPAPETTSFVATSFVDSPAPAATGTTAAESTAETQQQPTTQPALPTAA